jgi:hypothetical protein
MEKGSRRKYITEEWKKPLRAARNCQVLEERGGGCMVVMEISKRGT